VGIPARVYNNNFEPIVQVLNKDNKKIKINNDMVI
jgi:hypothetical protein